MMTREDVRELGLRLVQAMIDTPPQDGFRYVLRATSGTSGVPLFLPQRQPNDTGWFDGAERPVICFGTRNSRTNVTLLARHADAPDIRILALDGSDLTDDIESLLGDLSPTSVEGFPSFVENVGRRLGTAGKDVARVYLSGEFLTEEKMARLKSLFPYAAYQAQYVVSEAGFITKPTCEFLSLNQYHPNDGTSIHIMDPDEDGVGTIEVSRDGGLAQFDHYRVGDLGKLIARQCPCGESTTFEVIGRDGLDYVKLLGAVVRRSLVERVIEKRSAEYDDWRLEAGEVEVQGVPKGKLYLVLYRKGPAPSVARLAELKEEISRELYLTPSRTLADLVRDGIFLPLELSYTGSTFEAGHKDIRVRLRR